MDCLGVEILSLEMLCDVVNVFEGAPFGCEIVESFGDLECETGVLVTEFRIVTSLEGLGTTGVLSVCIGRSVGKTKIFGMVGARLFDIFAIDEWWC